jgi:hypothetical protein
LVQNHQRGDPLSNEVLDRLIGIFSGGFTQYPPEKSSIPEMVSLKDTESLLIIRTDVFDTVMCCIMFQSPGQEGGEGVCVKG